MLDKICDVPLRERLLEAVPIAVPEVRRAYLEWVAHVKNSVLIGGLAVGAYVRPRTTLDVDMLFLSEAAVPATVPGFKRLRAHAFEHRATGVEVEVLTPAFLQMPDALAQKIFDTARQGVVSAEGLIAAKLQRASAQDRVDVESVLRAYPGATLEGWPLTGAQQQLLAQIRASDAPRHEAPPDASA